MEKGKKHTEVLSIWLMFFGVFSVKFLSARYNNLWLILFLNLLMTGLIYSFYHTSRKHLKNIGYFALSIFLVFVAFPSIHFSLYSLDKSNYALSHEYIEARKNELNQELERYRDVNGLKALQNSLNEASLDILITDSLIGKVISLKDYTLKIYLHEHSGRPRKDGELKTIICYNSNQKEACRINVEGDLYISKGIENEILNYYRIEYQINHPKKELLYTDLFIDSISGFLFGNVKPISVNSQLIQLFQFISIFFFGYLLVGYLESDFDIQVRKK